MKISEFKCKLRLIIIALRILQFQCDKLTTSSTSTALDDIDQSKRDLEQLFASFNNKDLDKIIDIIKKRKKHRRRRKLSIQSKKCVQKEYIENSRCKSEAEVRRKGADVSNFQYESRQKSGKELCELEESLRPIYTQGMTKQKLAICKSQWNCILFGDNCAVKNRKNEREFINRRSIWDTYLASEDDKLGSSIPVGWVIPPITPLFKWKQFRKTT